MPEEIDPQRFLNQIEVGATPPGSFGRDLPGFSAPRLPALGEVLGGRFRLRRLLGQGGMGSVFVAEDEELSRQVAVKFMLQSTREGARERFLREAEVTARIRDPHVIQIHEAGTHEGADYLVYELIEGGRSLEDAFATLGLEERLDLVEQIAAGLGAAHAHGVVHRDLKPENVLIRESGTAVVADFGLAGLEESSLTNTGQSLGTPAYMSPEQVRGESPTPACDTWSLGILLYEAIFERHPLLEEGLTLPFLLARIYAADVEIPPCPTPALRKLLRRSLSAEPERRPPDGAAFREALAAARADQSSSPPTLLMVGLALVLTLVVAVAVGVSTQQPSPPAGTPSPVSSPSASPTAEDPTRRTPPPGLEIPTSRRVVDVSTGSLPAPDFSLTLEEKNFEEVYFLSEEEVVFLSSAGIAQRWSLAGEPRALEDPWTLPSPFRVESTLHGRTLLITSRVEGWVLDLDERRPRSLPKLEFVPTRLALFGDQGQPTALAASKSSAAWGKLGSSLLELDLGGKKVRSVSAERGRAALLALADRSARLYLLDSVTGSVHSYPLPPQAYSVALAPAGGQVLIGTREGLVWLYDEQGQKLCDLPGVHASDVRSVAWGSGRLAVASKRELSVYEANALEAPLVYGPMPPKRKSDAVYLSPSAEIVIVRRNAEFIGWRLPR